MEPSKTCSKCLESKPISMFHKRSKASDGLNYYCKACKSADDRKYRTENWQEISEAKRHYYHTNKETHSKKSKEKYRSNPQPYKDRAKRWKKENRELHNAGCMERYSMKMSRCPAWAKELTALACEEAYDKARRLQNLTGVPHDVDHIVPLKGKTASGLHVYNNFQVIPASENRSKKHLYWPNMW